MEMSYIIGGGISGLIAGYYLNIPIITDSIGGQFNSPFILGPRYFYDNVFCRKLLDDLEIKYSTKEIRYSYYYQGTFYEKIPKWLYDLYRQKTQRSKMNKPPKHTKFKVLIFDYNELMNKLVMNNKMIICAKVVKINLNKKVIHLNVNKRLNYNFLISTIPAKTFLDLIIQNGQNGYLRYLPIYYNVCKSPNCKYDENYDYVYYVNEEIPYYRITRICINDITYYVHESIKYFIPENSIYFVCQKIGKIITPPYFNYKQFKDIYFIGRYARWDENYMIHDSIRDILRLRKNFVSISAGNLVTCGPKEVRI